MSDDNMSDDGVASELGELSIDSSPLERLRDSYKALLGEVDAFAEFLKDKNRKIELRHYRNDISHDMELVQKMLHGKPSKAKIRHAISSSNYPFLQAIWDSAKRSSGVVGLKRHGSLVDVVADGGLLWVKVSTISEKRLLMEMAKQGWEGWDSMSEDDDDDDEDDAREASPPTDTDISILKMATRLAQAARDARVNYKHPSVVMELPRMRSRADRDADNTSDAVNTAIDSVLDKISSLGIKVVCGPQAPSPTPPRALSAVVAGGAPPYWATMLYDEFSRFTPRVNIDCTVLLALASDISHGRVTAAPWFNSALRRQLEIEDRERLLPAVLWPALAGGRELVCTREAARRMCEIAGSIGTEAEKARMSVLLDEGVSEEEKRKQLRALSSHDVPDDLKLPVRVYDRVGLEDARLPAVARQVAQELTDINKSVFLFGWAEGITTITSNKTSAKVIQTMVEKHRTRDDEAGPNVYVCFPSRSLVAKEKTRKGYE